MTLFARDRPDRAAASGQSVGTERGGRLDEIQGLRAVAVLLVVIYHAGLPLPGGFVGVDTFFVISGFVITRMLLNEFDTTGRIRFGQFYRRRVRRLLPAAALVVTTTLVGSALLQSPVGAQPSTALTAIGASTWTGNGVLFVVTRGYFALNLHTVPLLHTWSLAVEEQFYLVFPALLALAFAISRRRAARTGRQAAARTTAAVVIAVAFVLSLVVSVVLTFGHLIVASAGLAYFSPMSRAWEFAAGSLVCLLPAGWARGKKSVLELCAAAGLVTLLASAVLIDGTDPFPGYLALVPVLGTALVIASIGTTPTSVSRVLRVPLMQRLGDWSYSWYLWHWPLIVFIQVYWPDHVVLMTAAALVSIPLARLTYNHVEQPFRQRRPVARFATVRLAAVCIGVPIALSVALMTASQHHWGSDKVAAFAAQVEPKPALSDQCLTAVPLPDRNMRECTVGRTYPGKPIILIGDSNAAQYADGLIKVSKALGRPLTIATVQGCPFTDIQGAEAGSEIDNCHSLYESSLRWLRKQPPATVVMAAAGVWVDTDGINVATPDKSVVGTSPKVKGEIWRKGLIRTIRDVKAAGHTPVQVTAIPFFATALDRAWGPETCDFFGTLKDPSSCGESRSRAASDRMQRYGVAAQHDAAVAEGINEIDVRSAVCAHDVCATNDGAFRLYRDGLHLTIGESVRLAPLLERGVLDAGK